MSKRKAFPKEDIQIALIEQGNPCIQRFNVTFHGVTYEVEIFQRHSARGRVIFSFEETRNRCMNAVTVGVHYGTTFQRVMIDQYGRVNYF